MGCEMITLTEFQFVKAIYIKANSQLVKSLTFEMNDGERYSYGKDPIVESAYNHTVFEFTDMQRLMGAYGHQIKLEDGS